MTFWWVMIIATMSCISGPQSLVSGPLAQDIVTPIFHRNILKGKEYEVKTNLNAIGTIAGMIDGTGSVFSAVS